MINLRPAIEFLTRPTPQPVIIGPALNVTVHSTNPAMGGAVQYPGVIIEVYPDTNRAKVQFWRDGRWETFSFDIGLLEPEDHDIGWCLNPKCGRYDWYSAFDEYDCLCKDCQQDGMDDLMALAEDCEVDSKAVYWADMNEL